MHSNRTTSTSASPPAPKWRRRRPGRPALHSRPGRPARTTLAAGLPLALVGAAALTSTTADAGSSHHGPHAAASSTTLASPRLVSTTAPSPRTPGAVAAFGAGEYGGPGAGLAKPLVGIAPTPSGHGYWAVAADGGVFPFGDAGFFGSLGGKSLNKPIVGIAATRTGHGYWLVASDGGVFPFGDAAFHGALGNVTLNKPIVGIAATPTGNGYWLVASDGGVFPFGDAAFRGALAPEAAQTEVVGVAADPSGAGYWLATGPVPPPATTQFAVAGPNGTPLGTFVVTCYDLGGTTATGTAVSTATVAVDPSVIPLGSHIYVDGAGARIAEDTGGAIVGRRLDIWEPSYSDCAAWGVESRQVWMEG